jgi:alpha-tubulin suppressor-like RCC1 family protein
MATDAYQITQIACGREHILVLLSTGKVMAWGGIGSSRKSGSDPDICAAPIIFNRPIEIQSKHKLQSVSAGSGVNLGLTENGNVVTWGDSLIGIGGNDTAVAISAPELIANLPKAQKIAVGEHNFAIVDALGYVYTWGMNIDGVLGRPSPAAKCSARHCAEFTCRPIDCDGTRLCICTQQRKRRIFLG